MKYIKDTKGDKFMTDFKVDQKTCIKKFIRSLEDRHLRISKNKSTLSLLNNYDTLAGIMVYTGLVETYGEELVHESMKEELGEGEALRRLYIKQRGML
jgi:hypothetical protein